MSFVRPEVAAALTRWREVIACLALAAAGAWIATRGGAFYAALGGLTLAAGLGLALSAWRRLRFARSPEAPGVVEIDEGRIAYFGPDTGGVVALSELAGIDVVDALGRRCWRLRQEDGQAVTIPVAALGADRLYDVFAALPGAAPEAFLAALDRPAPTPRTLWRRAPAHRPTPLPRA